MPGARDLAWHPKYWRKGVEPSTFGLPVDSLTPRPGRLYFNCAAVKIFRLANKRVI